MDLLTSADLGAYVQYAESVYMQDNILELIKRIMDLGYNYETGVQ